MLMRNCCRVLLLAWLVPSVTLALGLGDIHLKSALNAPLDADVDLVVAGPDELNGLQASLASRDTFRRYGLDYPAFLGGVTITPQQTADGHTVLHLHSADAVNEPFATLLVEVNWARGHLVREYTVLLDPPVFAGDAASAAAVAAPVTGDTARSGVVERRPVAAPAAPVSSPNPPPAQVAAPSTPTRASSAAPASSVPPPRPAPPPAGAPGSTGGSYDVRNGDTLSAITTQFYGAGDHLARQRELVGVYRANTSAFDGNMNVLRAGSRLTMPGESELAAISPGEAATEVRRQYAEWNASHGAPGTASTGAGTAGPGQLRLVPPQEPAQVPLGKSAAARTSGTPASEAPAAASAAAGAGALQQRVSQLESQLAESQRLLQLKNSQLAALQAHPAPSASTPPPAPAAAAPASPAAPSATAPPSPAPAPSTQPPTQPPVAAAPPKAASPAATSTSGNSIVDLLQQYWYVPAGVLALLVALLVLRAVRARQEDAFDRSLGRLSEPGLDGTQSLDAERSNDTVPVRALAPTREEQSYSVEESGSHEQPPAIANKIATAPLAGPQVAVEENVSSEAPVALDQGDPLAEADFHMAYGLYDQAADLVQIAISREPARRDLRLKLLEVFFVWGNKDRFLSSARELASTRDKALPGEWEKIVIMGRQIAPEDPLFANSGALPGAASGGVDLNLEGGQNRIDFDLMGEPTVSTQRAGGLDLDLGAALADPEATSERPTGSESGIDFVFDDVERGNEATGSTREMPASANSSSATATIQVAGAPGTDPDAPTVEQPQLQAVDNPTIRQKLDAATRAGVISSEQTAELELHDLGLDLGPLDSTGDDADLAGGADAPTMLAGLDDETRQLLARAESQHDRSADETAVTAAPTESGTWLFNDADFGDALPDAPATLKSKADAPTEVVTQISPRQLPPAEADSSSTAQLKSLDPDELDLDLSDLRQRDPTHESNGLDLDVGPPATEGTFVQTQRIMAEDVALPDLEPATMSEVGTKLDLARAYMDMGDPEGARSILSEVLLEGSVSQKQEARRLIDTLPG